jgi:hypothetical protein
MGRRGPPLPRAAVWTGVARGQDNRAGNSGHLYRCPELCYHGPKEGPAVWHKLGRYAEITVVVAVGFVILHWILDKVNVHVAPIS